MHGKSTPVCKRNRIDNPQLLSYDKSHFCRHFRCFLSVPQGKDSYSNTLYSYNIFIGRDFIEATEIRERERQIPLHNRYTSCLLGLFHEHSKSDVRL